MGEKFHCAYCGTECIDNRDWKKRVDRPLRFCNNECYDDFFENGCKPKGQ
jgi:hypothetical protein